MLRKEQQGSISGGSQNCLIVTHNNSGGVLAHTYEVADEHAGEQQAGHICSQLIQVGAARCSYLCGNDIPQLNQF